PALLKSTSIRPISAAAFAYISRTESSSATSACSARSPSAPSARSTPTTRAPSSAKSRAVSAPIPLAAPVIPQTFPSSRAISSLACVVDVLHLGVGLQSVRAKLAADAGLLEAAEGGRDPHRGVRVDRDHAGVDGSGDPQRPGAVTSPDGARKAV